MRILIRSIFALLVLCALLFALLQSKWAKEKIGERIAASLVQSGMSAKVVELNGRLPFTWTLKEIDIGALTLKEIKIRVAALPLLKGKLVIDYLTAEQAIYRCSSGQSPFQIHPPAFGLDIRHFYISHVDVLDCPRLPLSSFAVRGSAILHPDNFHVETTVLSENEKQIHLEANVDGSKQKDWIAANAHCHLDIKEGLLQSEFSLDGPWKTFSDILTDQPLTEKPLHGECKGTLSDWKFKTLFSLASTQEATIQNFYLLSNLIHLKGKGILRRDIEKSKGMVAFSLPDLSELGPLSGSAKGKAFYDDGKYKTTFSTEDLLAYDFNFKTLCGLVQGRREGNAWAGKAKFSSMDSQIPFQSSLNYAFIPGKEAAFDHVQIYASDAKAQGDLSYDFTSHLYAGSITASAPEVGIFSPLLHEKNLGGSLDADCRLNTGDGQQNVTCNLLARNLYIRDYFLESLSLQASIEDLLGAPEGQLDLSAAKVYTPDFDIGSLDFHTRSDVASWPFSLQAEGRIDNPFQLALQGSWQKDPCLFTLELTQAQGNLAEIPFALQAPWEFEWGADYLNFSACRMQVGEGHLSSRFEFSPVRSLGTWDIAHFPLEIVGGKGFISSSGYFDATPQNIAGTLNASLEEFDHLGFRAKGTLQAHLDQNILQLFTDIHATDRQFLDFTATVPVEYQLYPFRVQANETRSAAAELIAEGKLQDLFNFVNLGPNYFSGLLSCRLYLSNTLASPSLLGQLQLQQGTYENYFTGISLRNIDARFDAHGDTVACTQLSGTDEEKGTFEATGKISVKPKEHFPFTFEAELKDLHAVGFDMIDANLSGPVYFIGSTQGMLAQGNLLIDEASIQIRQHLPYEVPSLPLSYVNFPNLYSRVAAPRRPFIFAMDLDLTAEKKVFVEGAGLNAELEGNVRLQGKNTNIAATGTLTLVKGEYQFAGKIFKLTEGEVVFNDKPVPSAYLNLSGTLDLPEGTVTAMLRGPLTSPQLTFQSNPQKSTSAILALILFNKDIAEISHPEAIQLANTLISLSGGAGPDVLESIRKSLGVDRLNISTRPGTDELAVQIGKYLTRGVLITLSQSATSSNVIVEVELPKGFVFQAETQEEEEGKFSLKWTKSY